MTDPIPAGAIRHGKCGNWWTGANRAHCGNCHRTFSGTTAFDQHQRGWTHGTDCPEPTERGLVAVPKKFGELWSWPGRPDDAPHAEQADADAEWYQRLVADPTTPPAADGQTSDH